MSEEGFEVHTWSFHGREQHMRWGQEGYARDKEDAVRLALVVDAPAKVISTNSSDVIFETRMGAEKRP